MVKSRGNTTGINNVAAPVVTSTPSESAVMAGIGQWLMTVLPAGAQVLQGQQNQTPLPNALAAIMMLIRKERLATNASTYDGKSARSVVEPTMFVVQVSTFGKGSGDALLRVLALFRDRYATEWFVNAGIPATPLYESNPRQLGFINEAKQYEDNWSADLHFQVNFTLTVPQQYADRAVMDAMSVDAFYPPEG